MILKPKVFIQFTDQLEGRLILEDRHGLRPPVPGYSVVFIVEGVDGLGKDHTHQYPALSTSDREWFFKSKKPNFVTIRVTALMERHGETVLRATTGWLFIHPGARP